MAAVAQLARQHLIAHQRVLFIDLHADKQNADDRAAFVFNRLILRDIAVAEQRRQPAIDLAAADAFPRRAGAIEAGADSAAAILFLQRGRDAVVIVAVAHEDGGDGGGAL